MQLPLFFFTPINTIVPAYILPLCLNLLTVYEDIKKYRESFDKSTVFSSLLLLKLLELQFVGKADLS